MLVQTARACYPVHLEVEPKLDPVEPSSATQQIHPNSASLKINLPIFVERGLHKQHIGRSAEYMNSRVKAKDMLEAPFAGDLDLFVAANEEGDGGIKKFKQKGILSHE